jgi:hypothetical protein
MKTSLRLFVVAAIFALGAGCLPAFGLAAQVKQEPDEPLSEPFKQALKFYGLDTAPASSMKSLLQSAIKPQTNDSPLRKLQREMCEARAKCLARLLGSIYPGKMWNPQENAMVIKTPDDLTKNLLEVVEKTEDKLKCYEFNARCLQIIYKFMDKRVEIGSEPSNSGDYAKAAWLDAEIDLLRFKESIAKEKK